VNITESCTNCQRPPLRPPLQPLPLFSARTRPGGPLEAASRPDGVTTMGRERSLGGGLRGRRLSHPARCGQPAASQGGFYLDSAETAGSPIISGRLWNRTAPSGTWSKRS
jgi:hypothetical protein